MERWIFSYNLFLEIRGRFGDLHVGLFKKDRKTKGILFHFAFSPKFPVRAPVTAFVWEPLLPPLSGSPCYCLCLGAPVTAFVDQGFLWP